ncbi:MAG: aminotransferase class IV [Flavobacteriales bacterium]|nr:aminotransferase class IV [Flavobacteriales bacterium]
MEPTAAILFNGTLTTAGNADLRFLNRALRLGDGFFETIRVINGRPHAWDAHYARIVSCCRALSLEPQPHVDAAFLIRGIHRLLQEHNTLNARLRLTFFRQGGGTYTPETNRLGFIGEIVALAEGDFQVKDEGLHLGLYTDLKKQRSPLAPYKLLGNHVYIQAAIWAARHHFDDVLVCNDAGEIIEATASNIFLVRKGELHTPPAASGCVGGVMRMSVLNAAMEAGIPCYETQIDEADILSATEVLLTNAVKGIAWVRSFRDKRYFHKMGDLLTTALNRRHSEYVATLEAAE